MKDKRTNRVIATGIYYNNSNLIGECTDLIQLDVYLKNAVLGYAISRGRATLTR
ncbi:hypothetical protein TUM3811_27940 [Shewanella algae]|nr:hypothetical protein TUM3811_27940 [Shewanella algae]